MPDSVSIAGQPIAFDYQCKVSEFLRDRLPADEVLFGRWMPEPKMHASVVDAYEAFTPPYPPLPPIEIGELQWPSGASRYARALYMVDRVSLLLIGKAAWGLDPAAFEDYLANWGEGSAVPGQASPVELVIYGEEIFATTMLPLAPYRVPGTGADLWLLPLVDRRWLWQQFPYEPDGDPASWEALFADLQNTIGTTIVRGAVASEYGIPDANTLQRGISATALLDCAALSVGRRIVMDPNSSMFRMLNAADSDVRCEATIAKSTIQAGSFRGKAVVPSSLAVFCRKANEFSLACNHQEKRTATVGTGSYVHLTHSAWIVDERYSVGSVQVVNGSETDYYVEKVAADLAAWLDSGGQYAFAGAIAYAPSGYDDYLTIKTAEVAPEQYCFSSRVYELPPVFLPNLLLSQAENIRVASLTEEFTAKDQDTDTGLAHFPGETSKTVFINGLDPLDSGKSVTAFYRCGVGWTKSVGDGGDIHYDYKLITNWFGGIALAEKRTMDMADMAQVVIVRDPRGIFSFQKSGDGGIMFLQASGRYYAVQANCKSTPIYPTDPVGACCYQSGDGWDCFDATEADCVSFGGIWKGLGTECATTDCAA